MQFGNWHLLPKVFKFCYKDMVDTALKAHVVC